MSPVSVVPEVLSGAGIPEDRVRTALSQILSSEELSGSPHLSSFLRYVVEETLNGRGDELSEYSVATEALNRSPDYDSRLDTIVRVQARRLRQRLDRFYERRANDVQIRIDVPKGGYRATFTRLDVPSQPGNEPARKTPDPISPKRSLKPWLLIAVGLSAAAFLGAFIHLEAPWQSQDAAHFPLRPLTSLVGWERSPSWSPDGSFLAYSHAREGDLDVYVRPTSGGRAVQLTDMPSDEFSPRWSPDGEVVAFIADAGPGANIYLTSPLGGVKEMLAETGIRAVERLGEARSSLGSNPWSPDGKELIFSRQTETGEVALWRIDRRTKVQSQLTFPEPGERHLGASWSFDGAQIVFERRRGGRVEIWLMNPQGDHARLLVGGKGWNLMPAWSADGAKVVFVSTRAGGSSLWDIEVGTGRERRLTTGAWDWLPAVSRDGRLAFNQFGHQQDLMMLNLKTGAERPLTEHTHENLFPRLSPDGGKVAYQSNRTGNDEIWVLDVAAGTEQRLTDDPARDMSPDWSPDGKQIVFLSERGGETEVWTMNADGSEPRRLPGPPTSAGFEWEAGATAPRWSPDGRAIGYLTPEKQGSVLWVVDLESGAVERHLAQALYFDWYLDSNRVIYTRRADDTRLPEVRAANLSTGAEVLLLRETAIELDASAAGDRIVYANALSHFEMNLAELALQVPESRDGLPSASGEPRQLTDGRGRWHVHGAGLSKAVDAVVYTRDADRGDIFVVEGYR